MRKYYRHQILLVCLGMCLSTSLWAADPPKTIYRSVGPGKSGALVSGGIGRTLNIEITGNTATVSGPAFPDNIGVGDVFCYNLNVAIIYKRIDGKHYAVQNEVGDTAMPITDNTSWVICRANTSLACALAGIENTPVPKDLDVYSGTHDLTAGGTNFILAFACYADNLDTTAVSIENFWITDETHYIKIYTPTLLTEVGVSQRHQGKWGSGYCLQISDATALTIANCNVRVEGLIFYTPTANFDHSQAIRIQNQSTASPLRQIWISQNIFRGSGATNISNYHCGIDDLGTTSSVEIRAWNNVFYDFVGLSILNGGIIAQAMGNTVAAYNNTFNNCERSFKVEADVCGYAINDLSQNSSNGFDGNFLPYSDFNISNLDTDAPGSAFPSATTVNFQNPGAGDFHLLSAGEPAANAGATLLTNVLTNLYSFSNDIDLQTRPDGFWDIGADEYYAPPPSPTPTASPTNIPDYLMTRTPTPTSTPTPMPTEVAAPALERAYPNPAQGGVVTFTSCPGPGENITIRVFSAAYKRVWQTTVAGNANQVNRVEWNTAGIPPGIYLYQIETGNRKSSFKKLAIIK